MNVSTFLSELEGRGVRLWVEGERLRYRAPTRVMTPDLRQELKRRRDELLASLRTEELAAGPAHEIREDWVAARMYSRLLGSELWLAHDERTAAELVAEGTDLPVLLLAEVPRLERKPPELVRAVLRTKCAFPGARWTQ